LLAFDGPTVTVDGTLLVGVMIPGGSTGQTIGGQVSTFEELILIPGDYLIRVTNLAAQAQPVGIGIDWYELSA
jgi:hypothetical protein